MLDYRELHKWMFPVNNSEERCEMKDGDKKKCGMKKRINALAMSSLCFVLAVNAINTIIEIDKQVLGICYIIYMISVLVVMIYYIIYFLIKRTRKK